MIGPQDEQTREQIVQTAKSLTEVVLEKNRRYGDSALKPAHIFNKDQDAASSIYARLDDKVGRIANASEVRKNDVADLMGYLLLLCVVRGWTDFSDQLD